MLFERLKLSSKSSSQVVCKPCVWGGKVSGLRKERAKD